MEDERNFEPRVRKPFLPPETKPQVLRPRTQSRLDTLQHLRQRAVEELAMIDEEIAKITGPAREIEFIRWNK